jgi:UDP-N-acetylmuramyl tripeptide synthase
LTEVPRRSFWRRDEALRGAAIFVQNSRQALAKIFELLRKPLRPVKLIGVTGTNGKTTTTYLLESMLRKAGWSPGVIGTINYRYGQNSTQAPNTTPESLDLQRILHEMVHGGVSHVVMEVSSHGLDLDRVYGCEFDGAIFTNLTSDHLDYHQTMGHYFQQEKLFVFLMKPEGETVAVTNHDDPKDAVAKSRSPRLRYD